MRTDLWDTDEWVSPSPEDEVRARVRRRARSLSRRRTVPMFAVLLLAVMMAIQQLPGTQSSSYVRVTGEGEHEEGRAEEPSASDEETAEDEESNDTTTTTSSSTTTTTQRSPRTGIEEPISVGIYGPPPAEIVHRHGDETLFADETGDARYHTGCADEKCPEGADFDENTRSQRAFDFTAADLRCTDKAMRLSFTFVDPDAPMDANSLGHRVDWIAYDTTMWFDDGTEEGGHVTIQLARKVATGELSVRQAYVTVRNEVGAGTGGNIPVEKLHPRFVGHSLVVDVEWAALATATDASDLGHRPPGPGTAFIMSEWVSPYFWYAAGASYSGGSDFVGYNGWDKRYLMCE